MSARSALLLLAALPLLLPATGGHALTLPQEQPAGAEGAPDAELADPPARVGRLALAQGAVGLRLPGEEGFSPAQRNLPIASGTGFRAEAEGRALLELPGLSMALEGGSALEFPRIDDAGVDATLAQGRLGLIVQALRPGDALNITTPRGTATIRKPGRYLLDAGDEATPTRLAVYAGQADFSLADGTVQRVAGGEALAVAETAALEPLGPPSPLLAWAEARGPKGGPSPAAVAFIPGAAALSQYGQWSRHPEYGDVWRPQVEAGWSPFVQGNWRNVEPWGWTWIDDAPWGFAPAHYGRWYQDDGAWYWAPQPVFVPRLYWPAYVPAVVRFGGGWRGPAWGGGWGAPVRWAPLAPREAFWPGRHFSQRWVGLANRGQLPPGAGLGFGPRPGEFARLGNARAAVAVPASVLRGSLPVARNAQRLNAAQLADSGPARLPAPVARPGFAASGPGAAGRPGFSPGLGAGARPPLASAVPFATARPPGPGTPGPGTPGPGAPGPGAPGFGAPGFGAPLAGVAPPASRRPGGGFGQAGKPGGGGGGNLPGIASGGFRPPASPGPGAPPQRWAALPQNRAPAPSQQQPSRSFYPPPQFQQQQRPPQSYAPAAPPYARQPQVYQPPPQVYAPAPQIYRPPAPQFHQAPPQSFRPAPSYQPAPQAYRAPAPSYSAPRAPAPAPAPSAARPAPGSHSGSHRR